MVTLGPPKSTIGSRIGESLGMGIKAGIGQRLKNQQNEREFAQEKGLLQEESRLKQEEIRLKSQQLKELFTKGKTSGGSKGNKFEESPENESFSPAQMSDEDIALASALDPNIGRSLQHSKDVALREKREETKAAERKTENLRKETLPIRTEIANRADIARRGIENKEKQLQLIDTGKIDDPTYATFLQALPMKFGMRFLSPETVEYKGGLVQGYGDLRNIFSGATRVKEIDILEQKIADTYLTDQQKKRILKSAIDTQKLDLIREEAAEELEGKPLSLLQYNKEIERISKPKKEALFNKILDEQKAVIQDAENRKKLPLDPNDPEDMQIAQQIIKEAGGDRTKARALAKKKGYTL